MIGAIGVKWVFEEVQLQGHLLIAIEEVESRAIRACSKEGIGIKVDAHPPLLPSLGGDDNHAIGRSSPVDSRCCCVLKNRDVGNVGRIEPCY